jgi:hypothetical protein
MRVRRLLSLRVVSSGLLAMQKVEGSSPFIRSSKAPLRRGFSFRPIVASSLRRSVSVHLRQGIAESVAECPLAVPAAVAGKQRRLRPPEASSLEASLLQRLRDPRLLVEGESDRRRVEPERCRAVRVEVLGLVELDDSWWLALALQQQST